MNDETKPPTPLTDQALARLRKLAEGNGLAPDKITLIETREKVYTLEGITNLTPFCEPHAGRYAGPVQGADRVMLPDVAALNTEAQRRQRAFLDSREWLPDVMAELKAAPAEGWGLDGAKITLPNKSVILAASEVCPSCQGRKLLSCEQCQGQGSVVCAQCQGRGMEFCYNCAGSGQNPAQPNQPCAICHGKRFIPCRYCHSSGRLVCPTCQGRRGTVCHTCNGTGGSTEEIGLTCGVTINFRIVGDGMPSGMRRGLDRLGMANLAKGHADIVTIPSEAPKKTEEGGEQKQSGLTTVKYQATLPYADLKMRFGDARAVGVTIFGKRGVLLGVPPFLDVALQPQREKLKQAANGLAPLDAALKARAMLDALSLLLSGQGDVKNLRRIYPYGLTPKAAQEILLDMRRALNRYTRHIRLAVALGGGVAGAALLAGILFTTVHAQLTLSLPWPLGLLLDLALLAIVTGACWAGLGKAVQVTLQKRFPDKKISVRGNTGKIGWAMLGGIAFIWLAALISIPDKPLWLLRIMWMFGAK